MSKGEKLYTVYESVVELLGLYLLDFAYFLWLPYPRGMFIVSNEVVLGAQEYITRFLFYALYFLWIMYFEPSASETGKANSSFRGVALKLAMFCSIRLLFDVTLNIATSTIAYIPTVVLCIVDSLFTFIVFYLLTGRFRHAYRGRKVGRITLFFICAGLFTLLLMRAYHVDQTAIFYHEKYMVNSNIYAAYKRETALSTQFVFVFWSMVTHLLVVTNRRFGYYESKNKKSISSSKRSAILLFCLLFTLVLKPAILGSSNIHGIDNNRILDSDEVNGTRYYHERHTTYISRIDWNRNLHENYQVSSSTVLKMRDEIFTDINTMLLYQYKEDIVDDRSILYYGHLVIFLPLDNGFEIVKTEKLKNQPYNKLLIHFLGNRVASGNFEWYEVSLPYLQKHDATFIHEYIERYALGQFSKAEIQSNPTIHPEYVQRLSIEALALQNDN